MPPPLVENGLVRHLQWEGGLLRFLDQSRLPGRMELVETRDYRVVCAAIRRLAIRGAPALGIAGAYALVLAAAELSAAGPARFRARLEEIRVEIAATRPTAVNLTWALERLLRGVGAGWSVRRICSRLETAARRLQREDIAACRALSARGAELIPPRAGVLTYCNTGGLATGGYGTALGILHTAFRQGRQPHVYVCETRPLFQGARLTAWELQVAGIPLTLITDNMAAALMRQGAVACVVVGADRIAANGDTANKIGTYALAVLARHHNIPFYVAAPVSTIDRDLPDGAGIPIEQRNPQEVTRPAGTPVAPPDLPAAAVANPAFDVTPAGLITALITERGLCRPPEVQSLEKLFAAHG